MHGRYRHFAFCTMASTHELCRRCGPCALLVSLRGRQSQAQLLLSIAPAPHGCHPARAWTRAASLSQECVPSIKPILLKNTLSKEQLAAVETTDTCIRVIAGPGSGKTRVLVHRVAHLIANCAVSAHDILFITFTNKAAQEIKDRIEQLFNSEVARDMTVCTFHGLCARILRWNPCSGFNKKFQIFDESDSERIMKSILKEAKDAFCLEHCGDSEEGKHSELFQDLKSLGFLTNNSPENRLLRRCLASGEKSAEIGQGKATSVPAAAIRSFSKAIRRSRLYKLECLLSEKGNSNTENLSSSLATLYENALMRNNALDFDALILCVVELLHSNDDIRETLQKQWKYILVDEFQDTDMVQYELIRLLASKHRHLFVVGDIDQAIYGWRGAELRHMQQSLAKDFPAIKTFQMRENFRSSSCIVRAASVVLSFSQYDRRIGPLQSLSLVSAVKEERAAPICTGEFRDQASEANFIASEILKLVSEGRARWESFALLYRTRVQALQLEVALSQAKVPYCIIGAVPFYADKEVKTLLSYLQYISNADNAAALDYCLNKPSRAIGDKTLKKIQMWASKRYISIPVALERIYAESVTYKELGIRANARENISIFMKLILDLRKMVSKVPVIHLIQQLIDLLNFDEHLQKVSKDEEQYTRHKERLEMLLVAAQNTEAIYGVGDEALSRFLEDISLLASNEEVVGSPSRDEVKLLTLHASKGLEFDIVFLVGTRDDLLPLEDADDDEERRLFYVGITRARKQLYLTFDHGSSPCGSHSPKISRFVEEIVGSLPSQYIQKLSIART